jgi:hypothetical protein
LAALQGGLLTGLVTDQTTAARLLDPSPPTRAALDSDAIAVE